MSIFQSNMRLWVLIAVSYISAHISFFLVSFNFWFGNWVLLVLLPAFTTFFSCRLILKKARNQNFGRIAWLLLLSFFGYFAALISVIVILFLLIIGVGHIMDFLGFSFGEGSKAIESTQPLDGFSKFFILVLYNYLAFVICSTLLFIWDRLNLKRSVPV